MAFNPSSTINLCNVPIDSTYKNEIFFNSPEEQVNYFASKTGLIFTQYLTVRETLPDGSLQSAVKVAANIDDLQKFNYMFYQNANHGTKYFYAFIEKLVYINENTTKIIFKTDVYQTWLFDVTLKDSYVVREHSETDEIGDNTTPEQFNFNEYEYSMCAGQTFDEKWGYLIGVNTLPDEIADSSSTYKQGRLHSGIYQGLYFYYLESPNEINALLDALEDEKENCVEFITAIPKFCVSNARFADGDTDWGAKIKGFIYSTTAPNEFTKNAALLDTDLAFDGYEPKNKKLFTHPYFCLYATNHGGQNMEYRLEHFANYRAIKFKYYGDCSPSPTISYIPLDYAGAEEEPDFAISVTSFPQCSFNSDTYKLWLAKNTPNNALNIASGIVSIIGGVAMGVATGGAALPAVLGAGSAVIGGAMGVGKTITNMHSQSYMPNKVSPGNQKSNLITAMEQNKVVFYWQKVKRHIAETIDSYFTMYGYQTNKLKIPNVSSRPYFNYIETIDINIVPKDANHAVPSSDMTELKGIYNSGVTLWKPTATVGDYSVDNRPT